MIRKSAALLFALLIPVLTVLTGCSNEPESAADKARESLHKAAEASKEAAHDAVEAGKEMGHDAAEATEKAAREAKEALKD